MRSFLSVADADSAEIHRLLARATSIERSIKQKQPLTTLKGKVIGVLFEKPSTRTRAAFEVAALRLGGHSLYLSANELQLSRGEPIEDTARILGGYLDGIVARVYSNDTVKKLAKFSGVPVVNALSDMEHPTQTISDLYTISQTKGGLKGLDLVFVGDGNNVCNSLLLGAALTGMNMTIACPRGYLPNAKLFRKAQSISRSSGSKLRITRDPKKAVEGADILYTDVWVSMGEEKEEERRLKAFSGYQINSNLLKLARDDAIVMHCLPAHRGLEITNDVIEGRQSVIWRQGENKLYGAAAVLEWLLVRGTAN
jgi:ornithine carbamoyltransferase